MTTVAYSPVWERRAHQHRLLPMLRATAERHRPVLEEWNVVERILEPFATLEPVSLPSGPPIPCQWCFGQRRLWEAGILGLVPLLCERCCGSGFDPR